MKTDIFSFSRLGLLFRRFWGERSRYELIQWITMTIVFMFIRNANAVGLAMAILISGVIYASNFYKDIHSQGSGVAYFMIPASRLEKTILGVVMTSFYYFAMIIIAYVIGNLLGTLVNNVIASTSSVLVDLNLFHHSTLQWKLFGNYNDSLVNVSVNGQPSNFFTKEHPNFLFHLFELFLIGQSIYLLGSIYFKRNHFFATFLATIVIELILLIVFSTELRLIFGNFSFTPNNSLSYDFGNTVRSILKYIVWLIPPFFWIVSYFRLSEKQI